MIRSSELTNATSEDCAMIRSMGKVDDSVVALRSPTGESGDEVDTLVMSRWAASLRTEFPMASSGGAILRAREPGR